MNIALAFEEFRRENPGVTVTNLAQVLDPGDVYARRLHETFKRFGRNAGFRNSVYEKYVFFRPGITNAGGLEGTELVMMNARPFPTGDGMMRYLVITGGDRYGFRLRPEWRIKSMLNELRLSEPKVTAMPPPIPAGFQDEYRESLAVKREKFSSGLAQLLGMSHTKGWLIEWGTCSVIAIAILLGWLSFRRRSQR